MTKLKETFLKKYAVWQYIAFAGGLVLFGYGIWEIVLEQYDDIWLTAGIALAGLILMASPMLYVKLFRRKTDLDR